MPIVSVDAVIISDGALLLLRRNNEPAKGEWWLPGGRVMFCESLEGALRREVKEETGLEIETCRFINVYSRVFPQRHDITIAYLCQCKEGRIKLNYEHSEYGLFEELPNNIHPFLAQTLADSNWEEKVANAR